MDHLLILVTCPDAPKAAAIARTLVEERLVACGNLIPGLRSIYRWEGAINDETESLLLLKTTTANYAAVESRVKDLHPYEIPEIIAFPMTNGLPAYLRWIEDSTQ